MKFKYDHRNIIGIFKNAFLYFGGSIVQLSISVFTSPVFARNLEAEDFAIIGYYKSLGSFIMPISTLSFTFYYLMKYFRQEDDENRRLISSLLAFLTFFNIIILSLSYGALVAYFHIGKVSIPFFPYSLLTISALFLEIYKSFILLDFRVKKKALSYFLLSSSMTVLSILVSLLLVVKYQMGAFGRMTGPVIGQVLVSIYILYYFRKILSAKFNRKIIAEGLAFSYPMIISAYFYIPISNIDKIFLERLNNLHEFGYYNIGFNIANYLGVAGQALGKAFEPDFFKNIIEKNKKKFVFNSAVYSLAMVFITLIFVICSRPVVEYLTSGRYTRAYTYANLNAIALLIMNLAGITNAVILALQKPKFMLAVNIISGVAGIIIYKIFIANWGFTGANYGRILISFVYLSVQFLFIVYRNSRILKKLS